MTLATNYVTITCTCTASITSDTYRQIFQIDEHDYSDLYQDADLGRISVTDVELDVSVADVRSDFMWRGRARDQSLEWGVPRQRLRAHH